MSGYYLYLPALFIYDDIHTLSFRTKIQEKYHPAPVFDTDMRGSSGNVVIKYWSGQAVLYSPFFFIGHFIANISPAYPADGFSLPYQVSLAAGMMLYAFLGLWILRNFLLSFFSDKAVALTLFCIAIGSNYFNYASIDTALSHNSLFTIYSLLLFFTHRYQQKQNLRNTLAIGVLVALATLVRPSEIISVLIPVLWNWNKRKDIFSYRKKTLQIIAAVIIAGMIIFVQFLYNKIVGGKWLIYTYGDEGFNWFRPHILRGLLSYKGGWILYSPVMFFSLFGFYYLYQHSKKLFRVSLIFFVVFSYICFSWETWWYAGSLGQRAMIHCYPVLAIPMTAFFMKLSGMSTNKKAIAMFFVFLFSVYSLWWTHQAHLGGLFRAGEMTKAYYWAVLGRSHVDPEVELLVDHQVRHNHIPVNHVILFGGDPKISTADTLNGTKQFSEEYRIPLPPAEHRKIRASVNFTATAKEWGMWNMTQFMLLFYFNDKVIETYSIRPHRMLNDFETRLVSLDAKMPRQPVDKITVQFWNSNGDKEVFMRDLKVISFP